MSHQSEFVISMIFSLLGGIGAIYTFINENSKAIKNKVCFNTLVGVLISMLLLLVFSSIERGRFTAKGSRPQGLPETLSAALAINSFYSLLFWNALLALEWYKQVHRQVSPHTEGVSWIRKTLAPVVLTFAGSVSFPKNSFIAAVQLGTESKLADPILALWTKYFPCILLVLIAYVYIGVGYIKGKTQLENRIPGLRKYSIYSLLISASMSPILINGCILLFCDDISSLVADFECILPMGVAIALALVSWRLNKTEEPITDPWISHDSLANRTRASDNEQSSQSRMILTEMDVQEMEEQLQQPECSTGNESIKEENENLMISPKDTSTSQFEQQKNIPLLTETPNSRIEQLQQSFNNNFQQEITVIDENQAQSPEIIGSVVSEEVEKKPSTPESDDSYTIIQKDSDTPTIITKEENQKDSEGSKSV